MLATCFTPHYYYFSWVKSYTSELSKFEGVFLENSEIYRYNCQIKVKTTLSGKMSHLSIVAYSPLVQHITISRGRRAVCWSSKGGGLRGHSVLK